MAMEWCFQFVPQNTLLCSRPTDGWYQFHVTDTQHWVTELGVWERETVCCGDGRRVLLVRLRVFVNALSELHFYVSAIVYRYSRIFVGRLLDNYYLVLKSVDMQIVLRFLAFVNVWMAYHVACATCITEQWNPALRPSWYYGHYILAWTKAQSDTLYLKNPFNAPPR